MNYKGCWDAKFLIKKNYASVISHDNVSHLKDGWRYMPPKDFELVTSGFDTMLFYVMRNEIRNTVSNLGYYTDYTKSSSYWRTA